MAASTSHLPVSHAAHTRLVPVGDAALAAFRRRAQVALGAPDGLALAFETPRGDRAAVSTDFALKLVLGADDAAGHLVLAAPNDLPTVDQCMHTVLQAVVDTAARGDAAAVFLALSGAWERAMRDFGEMRLSDDSSSSPMSLSPAPSPPRRSPSPDLHTCLSRSLDAVPDAAPAIADAACTRIEEWQTEACFCTHTGVSCSACHVAAIQGTRYRCNALNLCEPCRRGLGDAADVNFTVYEHPWEASEGYEDGGVIAPAPPLTLGDHGVAVLHLQYLLYRTGFLRLGRFRPGVFCRGTREGVRWVQREHRVGEDGVYNGCTRGCLVGAFEDVERRCGGRCVGVGATDAARLRTALAA